MDAAVSELNLTGEQWAELEAYDELYGLGYSVREDRRSASRTHLLMQAAGVDGKDIEASHFDYLPKDEDPDIGNLERLL